jgi:hypothetical protein
VYIRQFLHSFPSRKFVRQIYFAPPKQTGNFAPCFDNNPVA